MQTDTYGIFLHFMANGCHFLFLGACTDTVFACMTPSVHVAQ